MGTFSFRARSVQGLLPFSGEQAVMALRWVGWLVALALLARAYRAEGNLPLARHLLYGVRPAVLAWGAFQALKIFRDTEHKQKMFWAAFLGAGLLFLGMTPYLLAVFLGLLFLVTSWGRPRLWLASGLLTMPAIFGGAAVAPAGVAAPFSWAALGLSVVKAGFFSLGSPLALLALLWADWGIRWHWVTAPKVLDALAVGLLTDFPLGFGLAFLFFLLSGFLGGLGAGVLGLLSIRAWKTALPLRPVWWLLGVSFAIWLFAELAPSAVVDLPSALLFGLCLLAFQKSGFFPVAMVSSFVGYLWMVMP